MVVPNRCSFFPVLEDLQSRLTSSPAVKGTYKSFSDPIYRLGDILPWTLYEGLNALMTNSREY